MAEKENVITHTYDLLKYLVPQLSKYPRSQKFLLADRIQSLLMDLLEELIEAYYSNKEDKKRLLRKVNIKIERLRYHIRLSKDLKCIDLRRYEFIQNKINEIGKEVGGWLKSIR